MAKLLLDTHVLLFAFAEPHRLNDLARSLIADPDNDAFYSSASAWEVAIKRAKRPEDMPVTADRFLELCADAGYRELPIASKHVRELERIDVNPGNPVHSDPFDRILLCQARAENMLFITRDAKLLAYGDSCIVDAR